MRIYQIRASVRSPTVREGYVALADARASDTLIVGKFSERMVFYLAAFEDKLEREF